MNRTSIRIRTLGLAVLLAAGCCAVVQAQPAPLPEPADLFSAPSPLLTSTDLGALDASGWQLLTGLHVDGLDSADPGRKQLALQNLAFLAANYGDAYDFSSAAPRLYEVYRFDRREGHRVIALSALRAIGEEETMRLLARHAPWERSEFVRRMTRAVVAEHLGGPQ